MKNSRFLEFFLFLCVLWAQAMKAELLLSAVPLITLGFLSQYGMESFKRALRNESADFGTYFTYYQLRNFFLIVSGTVLIVTAHSQRLSAPFSAVEYVFLFLVLVLADLAENYAYFHRAKVYRHILINTYMRALVLGALFLKTELTVWELGLVYSILTLPDFLLLGLAWLQQKNRPLFVYLYHLRYVSFAFFLAVGYGYVHLKAHFYPQSSVTAYLALALKNDSLMKNYIDHGGDTHRIIREVGQKLLLAPTLIHRGMYGSLEHLRKKNVDFSSQADEYVRDEGQDVLIPIAMKDDVHALELVEHLPLRYDLRYAIGHSNILHFVSKYCAPKVAEIILPKIKREMLYEANAKGVTPLTSAADIKCQSVLDVYAKMSPNWNHTDRRGRSVSSIQKSASMITRDL